MTSEHRQWENIRDSYLKSIQKNLAQVNHPRRTDILNNVREHLENKYVELNPTQQNWENFQQIITEMGPPEEYAELLAEDQNGQAKKTFGINEILAIVFVIVLAAVGSYLVYNARTNPSQQTVNKEVEFELDQNVLGKWISVDFVNVIEDFDPSQKSWQGELFLKGLDLQDKGVAWWLIKDKKYKHHWTKGKVNPLSERPAFYYLRSIDGNQYLFFEWISGDVTDRGREPAYYVLSRSENLEWFENDPQAIGYWQVVDFVKTIEDFQPDQSQTEELFIKTLHFRDKGKLFWTIGRSKPIALNWTRGKIRPFDVWPTEYSIKQAGEENYLFYKHRTRHSNPAGYYVFRPSNAPESSGQLEKQPFVNDPQALGKWKAVDFVETIGHFKSDHPSWKGKLHVQSLDIKQDGDVEVRLGEDQMKVDHHWTKGLMNPDDDLPSRYTIKTYDRNDYLFMEWNSGDVTIRGQEPAYYVLKKEE